MAIPTFLSNTYNGPPQFIEISAADVNDILTQLVTTLVTNLGWTQPVGNTFKSPPQADGTFIQMALSRIDQFTLQMVLTDQAVRTICTRRIEIDNPGPTPVRIFAGFPYCVIESERTSGTWELLQAYILEPSPAFLADITNRVLGNGFRDSGSNPDGQGASVFQLAMWENGSASINTRVENKNTQIGGNQVNSNMSDATGRNWYLPADFIAQQAASSVEGFVGRLPNVYIGNSTVGQGLDRTVPIDTGTSGVFQKLGLSVSTQMGMFIRKS